MSRKLLLGILAALFLFPANAFAYNWSFSCGGRWSGPVDYYINAAGSNDLAFSTVEQIMEQSFDAWSEPCCSNFAAVYRGTTNQTALSTNLPVVMSWEEQGWPQGLGNVNVTIGVTLSSLNTGNCTYNQAPIVYNGVGFRFSDGAQHTDLGSIATHEIGHLLGLNHSDRNITQATMYEAYVGGTGARSLHQDDIDGVCSLYTRQCTCISASDCASGEQCINQQCVDVPCQSDSECEEGLVCRAGDCVIPPCGSDADCGSGSICQNEKCVPTCPACRPCESDQDCGGGAACINLGTGNRCFVFCQNQSACPGDAECFRWSFGDQGSYDICSDPNAQTNPCPEDYECMETGITDECQSDSDCAAGEVCNNTAMGRRCRDAASACDGISCPEGSTCVDGGCVSDTANNNAGNNTSNNNPGNNDTGANNQTGNNDTGSTTGTDGDTPPIIIFPETAGDDSTCSTAPSNSVPGSLLLLGVFAFARRRRKHRAA